MSDAEITNVAKWQKAILWLILVSFVGLFFPPLLFITGIGSLICIYNLAAALKLPAPWLYAVLGLIPYIGLVALFVINNKATAALKQRGIKVGLMGAKLSEVSGRSSTQVPSASSFPISKVLGYGACFLFAIIALPAMCSNSNSGTSASSTAPSQRIEDLIAAQIQAAVTANKQQIFDRIHPIGEAQSVKVHDVTITSWKHGQATNTPDDILQFTVRYTLYWKGPITTDGYTKITETFDTETGRYINSQILATNGSTNQEVGEAIGYFGGALLLEALRQ